jgi:hypothetical protein
MKIINKILFLLFITSAGLTACKKQELNGLSDIRPNVEVTVSNAADYRPDPTVTTTLAGTGAIQIVLTIPSNKGRTIKEITKVSASTSYTQVRGSTGLYNTAPIAGNGTTVTFTTSLTEYFTKRPVSTSNPAAKVNTELANRFYFAVTLDNGEVIYTVPVRVLVL